MKKSQRLKVIVDLNAENEKKALEVLGEVQRKKQALETQLESLHDYRKEYKDRYQSISQIGVNVTKLLEFRAFISKLGGAIDEQKQAILSIDDEVQAARKNWELQYQKKKSIQKVRDTALKEEQKIEDKREQKEQDERASQIGLRNGTRNA